MVITKGENSNKGIKANDQAVVIKQAVIIRTNPIRHLVEIFLMKIVRVTINSEQHLKIIQGMIP